MTAAPSIEHRIDELVSALHDIEALLAGAAAVATQEAPEQVLCRIARDRVADVCVALDQVSLDLNRANGVSS